MRNKKRMDTDEDNDNIGRKVMVKVGKKLAWSLFTIWYWWRIWCWKLL